jgi:hypothetical protein
MYDTYWRHSGSSLKPKVSRSAAIASGSSLPWKRENIVASGSPGMRRGMTKASVTDAHAASR